MSQATLLHLEHTLVEDKTQLYEKNKVLDI